MVTQKSARKGSTRKKPALKPVPTDIPIWEQIIEFGKQIPEEELANYPPDGATNLHHYLHGHPKQDPD